MLSDPISVGAQGSITPKWDVGEHDPPSRAAFGDGEVINEVRVSSAFPESTSPVTSHDLCGGS